MKQLKNSLFKIHIVATLLLIAGSIKSQSLNLIPYPVHVEIKKGTCELNNTSLVIDNQGLSGLLGFFNDEIISQLKSDKISKQFVDLKIQPSANAYGAYQLITFEKGVSITA